MFTLVLVLSFAAIPESYAVPPYFTVDEARNGLFCSAAVIAGLLGAKALLGEYTPTTPPHTPPSLEMNGHDFFWDQIFPVFVIFPSLMAMVFTLELLNRPRVPYKDPLLLLQLNRFK